MNGTGVWKWLAAFFAGLVIAGVPTMILAVTGPTRADFDELQHQLAVEQIQIARLQEQLAALIQIVRQHTNGG